MVIQLTLFIIPVSLLLAIVLYNSAKRENIPLANLLVFVAAQYFYYYWFIQWQDTPDPHVFWLILNGMSRLCIIPLFILYFNVLLDRKTVKWQSYLWMLPLIYGVLFSIDFNTHQYVQVGDFSKGLLNTGLSIILFIYWSVYFVWQWKQIRASKGTAQVADWNTNISLHWAKYLLVIFFLRAVLTGFFGLLLTAVSADPGLSQQLDFLSGITHTVLMAVLLLMMAYVALRKPGFLGTGSFAQVERTIVEVVVPKKNFVSLSADQKQLYIETIQQALTEKHLYLDNELNLQMLAGATEISAHQVSYLINDYWGKNFNEFINSYRIEHAKKLLADLSIDRTNYALALDSGFNSERTFYSAFKANTGQTPNQYRERLAEKR